MIVIAKLLLVSLLLYWLVRRNRVISYQPAPGIIIHVRLKNFDKPIATSAFCIQKVTT